ncbi:MAG: RagB/SusD family nutrient uptake outer membrane protein [Paramuribaculum sp.]|nr:RagB/SusD family nutrient uptake outer membrane protein [Paramuribaculum sp.]
MKAKYLLPLAVGACLSMQSCSDFLTTEPAAIYSEDLVWGSAANVEAFVMGRYGTATGWYRDSPNWDRTFSNNMINCRAACPGEARGLMENTYNIGLNDRFGYIRACNMIIERCGQSTVLSESDKIKYVAVGKLLRAMCYYDFARKTGKFIWVDKVLSSDDPDFNLPLTKSLEESYAYVLKDIREAIPGLPASQPAGAPDKNFGYAFLSEVCLTAAAYTNDAASLQNGKSLYQEAIDAVDAISGASLDPDYESIFNENGAYSSPEIILAQYWDKDRTQCQNTYMINLIANVVNTNLELQGCSPLWQGMPDIFECWLDYTPSQNLVDDYLVIDEQDGKAKRWYETSQFTQNTVAIDETTAFEMIEHKDDDKVATAYKVTTPGVSISDLMYNNRDARFDASILRDGSQFYGETIAMINHGNMTRWSGANYGANHIPLTNYCTRKTIYTNMSPRPFYNTQTAWHSVITRYGRALLNKAEAQLRLNKVADAVATFNQTRTIHGKLPASTASTLAEAWADYKIERRVELFWECDWYFSLLRWGKYGYEANDGKAPSSVIDELTEPATFIEINRDRDAAFVGIVQFSNNQRAFDTRSYLFPIPQSLINANSAITNADQNPGWE